MSTGVISTPTIEDDEVDLNLENLENLDNLEKLDKKLSYKHSKNHVVTSFLLVLL